ncbi:hypothetical protein HanRHA438_Chr05g0242281 [Helianthus annuus]|nr:hypothetical protein HanRHA438_Chr05g0242281 [Helianthus annuus]
MSSSVIKTWLVVASIGAVEALKDQGVARWNGPLKALHHHAKRRLSLLITDLPDPCLWGLNWLLENIDRRKRKKNV